MPSLSAVPCVKWHDSRNGVFKGVQDHSVVLLGAFSKTKFWLYFKTN